MNAQNDFLDNAVNDGLDMKQEENMQSQMCSFMNDDTVENCSLLQSDTCGDGMFIVQTSFRPAYRGGAEDG